MKVILLAALVCAPLCLAGEDYYATGLLKLAQGNSREGYADLERALSAEDELGKKGAIAATLAVAKPAFLARPKHLYARIALAAPGARDPEETRSLYRILGDGLYDSTDIDGSARAYEQALSIPSGSTEDRDYLVYKLGWTHISRQNPDHALELWMRHLDGSLTPGPLSPLRKLLVKDSGRAWIEALYSESKDRQLPAAVAALDRDSFSEGVIAGLNRMALAEIALLAGKLSGSTEGARLRQRLLPASGLFDGAPCRALPLLEQLDAFEGEARGLLLACSVRSLSDGKNLRLLSTLLARVELKNTDRWLRARVHEKAGLRNDACADLGVLLPEQLSARELANVPAIVADVVNVCSEPLPPGLAEVVGKLFELPEAAAWRKVLVTLAESPVFGRAALAHALAAASLWRDSDLPVVLMELHSKSPENQQRIFEAFARVPIDERFSGYLARKVHRLIEKRDNAGAKALLVRYAPLGKLTARWAQRLWAALALSNPGDETAIPAADAMLEAARAGAAGQEDLESTVALQLRLRRPEVVWSNWQLLAPAVGRSKPLARALYAETLEALPGLLNAFKDRRDPALGWFARINALLDPDSACQNGRTTLPAFLRNEPLARDIVVLESIRALEREFSSIQLAGGPRLEKVLSRKISALKTKLRLGQRQTWASKLFLDAADRSISRMALELAKAIDGVGSVDAETKIVLENLSKALKGWRLTAAAEGGRS